MMEINFTDPVTYLWVSFVVGFAVFVIKTA